MDHRRVFDQSTSGCRRTQIPNHRSGNLQRVNSLQGPQSRKRPSSAAAREVQRSKSFALSPGPSEFVYVSKSLHLTIEEAARQLGMSTSYLFKNYQRARQEQFSTSSQFQGATDEEKLEDLKWPCKKLRDIQIVIDELWAEVREHHQGEWNDAQLAVLHGLFEERRKVLTPMWIRRVT